MGSKDDFSDGMFVDLIFDHSCVETLGLMRSAVSLQNMYNAKCEPVHK